MSSYTFKATKDLAETLNYTIDYTADLNASEPQDILLSSEWRIEGREDPPSLTQITDDITSTATTVFVTGGTKVGDRYRLINRVNSFGGLTFERTILIEIVEK